MRRALIRRGRLPRVSGSRREARPGRASGVALEIDEHERLLRGDHQRLVRKAIGGALVRHARPADAAHADERLDQVVEPGGRVILDRGRAHDELPPCYLRSAEVPVVLGSGVVEVREVAAVVDDALRVRVREPDARERRVLERGAPVSESTELRGTARQRQARITPTTSSRFSTIRGSESASRFSRRRGSVFDGRTLKCQSSKSIEIPSR